MAFGVGRYTTVSEAAMFHGALMRKSAAQTIATATPTTLTWDVAEYDTDILADLAGDRFVVGAGIAHVRVGAQVAWETDVLGGRRHLRVLKNGAEVDPGLVSDITQPALSNSLVHHGGWSPPIPVVDGDVFTLQVEQTSGGDLDVLSGRTWFALEVVKSPFGR